MIKFLIDADIAIYLLRRSPIVTAAFGRHEANEIGLPSIVHSQLLQGLPTSTDPDEAVRIAALADAYKVQPYDRAASEAYGAIVAIFGHDRVQTLDRMIAAHAISLGATLVTNNTKDFARIPSLKLANWTLPQTAA